MVDLTVPNVSQGLVDALKRRAVANGRSVEEEHRELLSVALLRAEKHFVTRATALQQRLHSSADTTDVIRADRDGAS